MSQGVRHLWRYRELARNLVYRDLRLRYGGSRGGTLLGLALSLIKPLLVVLVYLFGLRSVLRVQADHYPLFLGVGLLHWQLLSSVLLSSCQAVVSNGGLVDRAAFPRMLLPMVAVVQELVTFAFTFGVFLLALYPWIGGRFWWGLCLYPVGMALHLLFLSGAALAVSSVQVYWRDLRDLVEFGLRLGFWLSPVLYASTRFPAKWQQLLFVVNPAVPILELCRDLFCLHKLPAPAVWVMLAVWSLMLIPGYLLFASLQSGFADEL
ncbi:hypothetical protein ABS71_04635 [bacterium SCN 62-11]|nr:ABC transporter permease [Candidatus Eremiobacteraeota bacterium]ODT75237.1 MAG: hypothetical protein ABS71_04635 [bacterium SCN 62-11]